MTSWFGRRPAPPAAGGAGGEPGQATGVPLELITYDQDTGKFQLGPQALAVLKQTRGPVAVVAVCGRARQVRPGARRTLQAARRGGWRYAHPPPARPSNRNSSL
jgi:hypothetical protein